MHPRGGRVSSLALATHHRTSGSARTAPRQRCFDPAGAPFAFGRTWPSGRRQTGLAQNAGSIHDWVVRRVETARISLTHTPRFRLAPCVGQNGARPDIGRFCTGEYALGALEGRFGFPGRSVRIGGHAPARGVHPSVAEVLGVPNADLPVGWSLSTPSSPKPHVPQSAGVRADGHGRVWVGLLSDSGISNSYQTPGNASSAFWCPPPDLLLEDSVSDGPPPAWAPRLGRRGPDIGSRLVRAVFIPIWARSRAVPTGLLEGWYPANTDVHRSRTRAPGVLGESGRAV